MNNKNNTIIKIIKCVLAPIIVILIPFSILIILHLLYPSADAYLLTGFSFYIFIIFFIWIIPILIIISIILKIKNNMKQFFTKDYLKKECKKNSFWIITFVILVTLGSLSFSECYKYYKDIKNYPQDAIMKNVTIYKSYNKSNKGYFITGYINGKKTKLELIRDAKPNGNYIKSAKKVRIYYYKNIKEIYKIKYLY